MTQRSDCTQKIGRDSRKGFDCFLFAIVCHAIAKIKFLRLR
jgi:hypothetical protein